MMDIEEEQERYYVKIGSDKQVAYDIRKNLGHGPFSRVYQGIMNDSKKRVAVKIIHCKADKMNQNHINFQRQINLLKKSDNPYILKFQLFHIDDQKNVYIVTELCQESNLQSVIKQKSLSQEKAMDYSYQILQGVYYLHCKLKVIHRDLKTQNILLKDNKIKIADFGCSKDINADLDIHRDMEHTKVVGTPVYSSPQLIRQESYSAKCDVWSIGCIIYEMLTGQKLFSYKTYKQLKEDQKNERYITKIKQQLRNKNKFWTELLVNKMLVKQQKQRSTVEQLLRIISVQREKEKYINLKIKSEQKIKELQDKLLQQTALKLKWKSDNKTQRNLNIDNSQSRREQQFSISFILPHDKQFTAVLVKGTTIDEVINEIKTMEDGLRPNISNNDFRITNLSEGRKFDHVKLTHKVEQLGTGELKVKFQQSTQAQVHNADYSKLEQQFIITLILPNDETLNVAADKGTIIDKIIDEMKATNNLRKEINNNDFRITNLSKGRKFDHVKLTHKIEQLGTGELKIKVQQPEQQFDITFILPNSVILSASLVKGTTIDEVINEIKTMEDGLRPNISNNDFRITNLSEGRKFDRVKKLTHKVEQLGTGELKIKFQQPEQKFGITFILPNGGTQSVALVKGTTIDEVINEIKTMENGLRRNINNNDFRITNLSEGRRFNHVKLTHKVEQLGTGKLKIKFQQPAQMQEELFITLTYDGVQTQVAVSQKTQLSEVIQQFKKFKHISPSIQLIPKIAGVVIYDAQAKVINKRYKNKVIELVQQATNMRRPAPISAPKKLKSVYQF